MTMFTLTIFLLFSALAIAEIADQKKRRARIDNVYLSGLLCFIGWAAVLLVLA